MIQFLSLFSGIGAFEKALDRLGVSYSLVNYCEIDKYASKSYSAMHGVPESLNLGDITKVDTSKLPHIDMISYGFPCQDISLAGKQKGLKLVCEKCNTAQEISEYEVKKNNDRSACFLQKMWRTIKSYKIRVILSGITYYKGH